MTPQETKKTPSPNALQSFILSPVLLLDLLPTSLAFTLCRNMECKWESTVLVVCGLVVSAIIRSQEAECLRHDRRCMPLDVIRKLTYCILSAREEWYLFREKGRLQVRLNPSKITSTTNRITKMLSLLFFPGCENVFSETTEHVIRVIQRFIQAWWLISWPARESFSLPKAHRNSNLAHRGEKNSVESWVAWIALPTCYSHTRYFTALQNWLALPTVCSGKPLARSEKHKIFIGQQWKQSSILMMSSQIYKEV